MECESGRHSEIAVMTDELDIKKLVHVVRDQRATVAIVYPIEVEIGRRRGISAAVSALLQSVGGGYGGAQVTRVKSGIIATHVGQYVPPETWGPVFDENESAIAEQVAEEIAQQTGRPKQRLEITSVEEQESQSSQ